MSQPENCCVWHIETSDAICIPLVGLQHTHCPFSVDDSEALASYSLLEWSVSTMSSLQVITDVQMHVLIKLHKWKCPILGQLHENFVNHIWQFWYGQERRKRE